MGGARFGPLDGLLLLLLQAAASWLALCLSDPARRSAGARWLMLTAASYGSAFVVHIAAFAVLGRLLPGEGARSARRLIVALVWTGACALVAWGLSRRWNVQKPQRLVGWIAVTSAAAYGLFVVWGLLVKPG